MSQVLIVHDGEVPVESVARHLRERGLRVVDLDTSAFPERLAVTLRSDGTLVIREHGGVPVVLDDVRSVWYRRARYASPVLGNPEVERAIRKSSQAFLQGLLASFDGRILQDKAVMDHASLKPRQLTLAQEAGLDVPVTLTTTSASEARAFVDRHGGAITKALRGVALAGDQVLMTTPITASDVADLQDAELGLCPMTVQERLRVAREHRVILVGEQVFSASLDAADIGVGEVDWRRHAHRVATAWKVDPLEAEVEQALLRLARRLHLDYGAADFIRTEDGRMVFLELNPAGEYLWIDGVFGGAIGSALADWLAGD